jgi:hypothetical protein
MNVPKLDKPEPNMFNKLQISKLQIPNKFQTTFRMIKNSLFGILYLLIIWDLGFVIWRFPDIRENSIDKYSDKNGQNIFIRDYTVPEFTQRIIFRLYFNPTSSFPNL